jgi:fibro-slime domain-containing protein
VVISNRYQGLGGWLLGCATAALLAVGGCGARTTLKTRELCSNEGAERACRGPCGQGTQLCQGGAWQACQVKVTERACENECGSGTQHCENDEWGACQVSVTQRSCEDTCGVGTQSCEDNQWSDCQVAPVTGVCANTCGQGLMVCENNSWGTCQVEPVVTRCENDCGPGQLVCENDAWGECEVEPTSRTCFSACGEGIERCESGSWRACDAPQPRPPKLNTIVRDFSDTHPDFESDFFSGDERGMVEELLGPDDKPVRTSTARSITSDDSFYSWYRDVDGVNLPTQIDLQLVESTQGNALFEYSNFSFFPIDDQLLGNEGRTHNYHFTLEAVTEFRYVGGEVFTFIGDDDIWVFINRRLAIDIGGLHTTLEGSVQLDAIAQEHDLVVGEVFPLHIFFAERHTVASNFTIETSIAGPPECD